MTDTLKEISELSGCKNVTAIRDSMVASFSDNVTKKKYKLIKKAFFQFISDTKIKI